MHIGSPRGPRTALPLLALALAGCAGAAPPASPAPRPAPPSAQPAPAAPAPAGPAQAGGATGPQVTAQDLRARLSIVAHDSMEGRRTGTPVARRASDYLVRELTRLGVRPAGDGGSYLARVPLVQTVTGLDLRVRPATGAETAIPASDLALLSGLSDVPGNPRPQGEGPVVFGGYLADPTVPAARELRPEQVRGSVLVLRFGAAPGTTPTSARFDMAQLFSPQSPAAAVVLVVEPGPIEEAWSYLRSSSGTMKVDSGTARAPIGGGGPPVFLVSAAAAERLIGQPLAQARQPRTGLGTLRYRLDTRQERVEGWNVVGVLPGSDPARAGEYVSVGAHYDHIGIGDPVDGDSINNGADDDGSGTVAVLEIAERYAAAAQRPARSLLFVWHTAEEEGLLGSEYFTDHPTVPRGSIVAQLNIDMIGRNHPDSLSVVGSRRISTGLGATIEAVNRRAQRPLLFDYGYDAPGHPEQIFCRSDHYNYARYGIPIAFFTIGLHPDYHKTSDELEKIDFDKLTRVTQLIGDVVGEVSNAAARPVVDRPVPPLGTPCVQ